MILWFGDLMDVRWFGVGTKYDVAKALSHLKGTNFREFLFALIASIIQLEMDQMGKPKTKIFSIEIYSSVIKTD